MSKREQWLFRYPAASVANAAQARLDHHVQRLEFWMGQHVEADRDLREHGTELREEPITGGTRLVAVLDPERAKRLNECNAKLDKHRGAAETYQRWVRVLRANPDQALELDFADMTYFGL